MSKKAVVKRQKIKQGKPKYIKRIDYGINIWNPEFGLYKNTTKRSERPSEIIVENQIQNAPWYRIKVDSRYYFNPTEINLAKILYGAMVNQNQRDHLGLTREEQNNGVWTMDLIEILKLHFPDLDRTGLKTKKRQMKNTIEKLMELNLVLWGKNGDTEIKATTSFFIEPKLFHNKEQNRLEVQYKYSEWFDIERQLIGDKRTITTDFLTYQHIDTRFPAHLERFNEEENSQYIKTVLTHFKSMFDFKNGLRQIEFNVRKNIEEIVSNWEELKGPTQRQYLGAYISAFETIEKDKYFSNYFKRVGGKTASSLPGFSEHTKKTRGDLVIYDIHRF